MPAKYSIHTKAAPPRFRPVGKLGIVDWREDCSSCHNCVKRSCVYGLYRDEADTLRDELGYLDYIYQCKGCLSCIQNCTKNILTRVVNPEYQQLGDAYYTPDIILSTWYQAEAGRIPVSGSGYGGPFQRAGVRFDVDRHVGNRPPDARRHPRPRIHQHERGHRPQAGAPGVHGRRSWTSRRRRWSRSAAGDFRSRSAALAARAGGRGGCPGGGRARHLGRGPPRGRFQPALAAGAGARHTLAGRPVRPRICRAARW